LLLRKMTDIPAARGNEIKSAKIVVNIPVRTF
jgi:hypothetical protein